MEDFQAVLEATLSLFQQEFTIYGFTLNWLSVFCWSIIAAMLLRFICDIFGE